MSRLRVGSDVGIRTGDEEVELLHELAPLGHQQHTTTLALHELEATRRAGAHEAGIPVGPRHGIGGSRFYALRQRAHVVAERCVPGTRGVEDRVQIEPHLLRLALHEEIEGGRRLHAQRTLATSHRRACADGLRIHAEFAQLVHQLLRSGRIDPNAKRRELEIAIKLERHGHRARILFVHAVQHTEHHRAVFDGAAHGPHAIHRPRQHHAAVSAHPTVGGPQCADAVANRGRDDRALRFRADRKRDASGGGRRARTGGAAARTDVRIPRIVRAPAEPPIVLRKQPRGQLRQQHRARVTQAHHDFRIDVGNLVLEIGRAPRGGHALDREQILDAVRNTMQRSTILTGGDLGVGPVGFRTRLRCQQRDHEVERRVELLDAREIDVGDLSRRDLARLDQRRDAMRRQEREVVGIGWHHPAPLFHRVRRARERGRPLFAHHPFHERAGATGIRHELHGGRFPVAKRHRGHLRRLRRATGCHAETVRSRQRTLRTSRLRTEGACRGGDQREEHELTTVYAGRRFIVVGGGEFGLSLRQKIQGGIHAGAPTERDNRMGRSALAPNISLGTHGRELR